MSVRIITDSAASLPTDLAREYGVDIVPIHITIGTETLLDGEIATSDLLARADDGVTTAAPTPGDYRHALQRDPGPTVIVTVGSQFSASFDAARLAAAGWEYPIEVVDSRTAAGAQGLVALATAEIASQTASLDAAAARARQVAARVRIVAGVGDLTRLIRSGRVPRLVGPLARAVDLKPMFEVSSGRIHRLRPVRGRGRIITRIIGEVTAYNDRDSRLRGAALHAGDPRRAAEIIDAISAMTTPDLVFSAEFGPAMIVHTGTDVVGFAWYWDDDSG